MISKIVQIIAQDVTPDWYNPYKTLSDDESIGTGFFIDNNGFILTCYHVVENSVKLWITIPKEGKQKMEAKIVSVCPASDVALLKVINYKNKEWLDLGDSDKIKQGDKVTAIGYPLGQDRLKYTSGIISGRQGGEIQTDAPINPGNSGGPLINSNGKVIGINSSKKIFAENIGYAVPIYDFLVVKDIMHNMYNKQVSGYDKIIFKPKLAAMFQNTDKNLLEYLENPTEFPEGYMIKKLYNTSPLKKVGIKEGDVICSFNGCKIDNYGECDVDWNNEKVHMKEMLGRYKLGDIVEIVYWSSDSNSNNKFKKVKVPLDVKHPFPIRKKYHPLEKIDYEILGGLVIMELNEFHIKNMHQNDLSDERNRMLLSYKHPDKKQENILFITNILKGSYIKSTDMIESGEFITKVNGTPVKTIEELRKASIPPNPQTNSTNAKHIIIDTDTQTKIALNIPKILEEENELSEQHKYKTTKLMSQLSKLYGQQLSTEDKPVKQQEQQQTMSSLSSQIVEPLTTVKPKIIVNKIYFLRVV
jgi:S1-C subfamily serine protease